MGRSIAAQAPAKLNLALAVGPPFAQGSQQGLHPICSWMVTIDLFDDLLLTRLEPGRLPRYAIMWHADAKRRSEINWSVTKDLAVRAHAAMERHIGRPLPVQMKLEKRIPVGGGLGGGSSDAAAMLRAVNELFELGLSIDELAAIGASIGADVPFLVHRGSAVVEGVGERISRGNEKVSPIHAVVAFPQASCPTAAVYSLFDQQPRGAMRSDAVKRLAQSNSTAKLDPGMLFNDLTDAAIQAAPQLRAHLRELADLAQRPAHVSGSGSSLFVICDDAMHAQAMADAIERRLALPAVSVRSVG